MRILFLLLVLAACGRGLTDTERALVFPIMGDTFNPDAARMVEAGFIGMTTRTYLARPQTTCREKINPPPRGPTIQARNAGAVAWTHVLTNPDWTIDNYAEGFPDQFNLVGAMFFAHEMTHIWQWQNRDVTGYSPFRGLAEHKPGVDPYLFDPNEQIAFLDLGYEQQASMVEEFICSRTIAPDGARIERLWDTLRVVMPVQHPTQTPKATGVFGVYEDANLEGVCD